MQASEKAKGLVAKLNRASFTLEESADSGDRAKENFCAWRAANREVLAYIASLEAKQ